VPIYYGGGKGVVPERVEILRKIQRAMEEVIGELSESYQVEVSTYADQWPVRFVISVKPYTDEGD